MKLKSAGVIKKNGKVVGDYRFSYLSCSFCFQINGRAHHFWGKEELEEHLQKNGYTIGERGL